MKTSWTAVHLFSAHAWKVHNKLLCRHLNAVSTILLMLCEQKYTYHITWTHYFIIMPDMIKSTCILDMWCQRSCRVFEIEGKVQVIQQTKTLYLPCLYLPACQRDLRRRQYQEISWDNCVPKVPHVCYIARVCISDFSLEPDFVFRCLLIPFFSNASQRCLLPVIQCLKTLKTLCQHKIQNPMIGSL